MARADSTIRVNILGDAKSLQKAAATSETALGGMNKKLVGIGAGIGAAFAADAVLDFAQTALAESDRVGDAATRLEGQLGGLAQPLIDAADGFSDLGASEGDMLDLEARIVDIGKAAGIADTSLAPLAQSAAEVAAQAAIMTDIEADVWIDKIGKAASSGDARALRDLGINLDEAAVNARALADTGKPTVDSLTESELAAARMEIIVGKLRDRYGEATSKGGDFAQKQDAIGAKIETLSGDIGGHLEGPLDDFLTWVLDGIAGFELLGTKLDEAGVDINALIGPVKLLTAPFLVLNDVIARSIDLLGQFFATAGQSTTTFGGTAGPRAPGIGASRNTVTVNVQGGSPEAIEQAVRNAVRTTARRG